MTQHYGSVPINSTLYIPFHTFNSSGASVTLTGLAVTDIEIYKNGSVTQRSSDAGYTLLDTDGIDFDGITGIHGFSIDLSDNTDSGFFSRGGQYWVVVSAVTVDAQTVNFITATFRIGFEDIADDILDRDMATGTDSGSPTVRTVRQALRILRNKVSSSAGTLTVTKENDSTSSWTAALTTDAAAEPIITVDPA